MKVHILFATLAGASAFVLGASAQTTVTTFAPANFGDMIVTTTPSNATGSSGISSIFTSSGQTFNFGTGGSLVNPASFTYTVNSPTSATITTPGSDSAPATITNLMFTSATGGTYTTLAGATSTNGTFNLAAIPSAAALANMSVRTTLDPGEATTIGFVVGGTMPRTVLIRGVGPGLATFGVTTGLANPVLTLFSGNQILAINDDWGTIATIPGSGTGTIGATVTPALATAQIFTQVGAFGLAAGSLDAAMVVTLSPGGYTIDVRSSTAATDTGTGDVLVEIYFVD